MALMYAVLDVLSGDVSLKGYDDSFYPNISGPVIDTIFMNNELRFLAHDVIG
jgi:hypothetical protein